MSNVLARGMLKMHTLPTASMMITVSPSASFVWRPGRKSSGLGLTPDFEELEENVEYEEAEDEFDLPLSTITVSVTQTRMKTEHDNNGKELFEGLFQTRPSDEHDKEAPWITDVWPVHLRPLWKTCQEAPVRMLPIRSLS